jgi:hypothetical protein
MDAGINNFLGFALQNPKLKNGMDAIFEQRKGLKRYPFLPAAKKIQAESPVRPRKWPDAPKIGK